MTIDSLSISFLQPCMLVVILMKIGNLNCVQLRKHYVQSMLSWVYIPPTRKWKKILNKRVYLLLLFLTRSRLTIKHFWILMIGLLFPIRLILPMLLLQSLNLRSLIVLIFLISLLLTFLNLPLLQPNLRLL